MSRTIAIIGTDWTGADPTWVRQPFSDHGRLKLDRTRPADWANVFHELGTMARLDSLAVGIRGDVHTGAVQSLPLARTAWGNARPQPTLMPWYDTVGLPDLTFNQDRTPFDFANPTHIEMGWQRYARIFFDHFKDTKLERSPRGKVLAAWWGIESRTGHGFVNQHRAQNLLNYVNEHVAAMGLGGVDHIVDQSWVTLVPNLSVFAVHDWFNPWGAIPQASSIRVYNGIVVGVAVPSFYRIINPAGTADVLAVELASFRAAKADYVFLEGGTNFIEGAELMRDSTGSTAKLDAIRAHVALIHPLDEIDEGEPVDAVTKEPLEDFVLFDALPPGNKPDTYALPWNEAKGEVDPTSDRVFSLQSDGSIQTRENKPFVENGIGIGDWESARITDQKLLVFRTGKHIRVFGVIRGV